MELTFDFRGNLKPHKIIELTLNEFEEVFVSNFVSQKRVELFDAYLVYTYPEDHEFYDIYKGDKIYWQNTFGQTRFNRAKKRFPKGFVEIRIS